MALPAWVAVTGKEDLVVAVLAAAPAMVRAALQVMMEVLGTQEKVIRAEIRVKAIREATQVMVKVVGKGSN